MNILEMKFTELEGKCDCHQLACQYLAYESKHTNT